MFRYSLDMGVLIILSRVLLYLNQVSKGSPKWSLIRYYSNGQSVLTMQTSLTSAADSFSEVVHNITNIVDACGASSDLESDYSGINSPSWVSTSDWVLHSVLYTAYSVHLHLPVAGKRISNKTNTMMLTSSLAAPTGAQR